MMGYETYLAIQDRINSRVYEAYPNAPVISDAPRAGTIRLSGALFRQRLGLDLRRLADLVDPAPPRAAAGQLQYRME